MNIVIPGQTPSQKNNKVIIPSKPPRLVDNKIVREWREKTATYLSDAYTGRMTGQTVAIYTFYLKDRTRRDIDNMIASCNDALMHAGIIPDDNWQVLQIGGASACLDRENPRAEIELYEDEWSTDD